MGHVRPHSDIAVDVDSQVHDKSIQLAYQYNNTDSIMVYLYKMDYFN